MQVNYLLQHIQHLDIDTCIIPEGSTGAALMCVAIQLHNIINAVTLKGTGRSGK